MLVVCRQTNNEASMFVNDICITRLESGALCTAGRIPARWQSIIDNTLVLKMPMCTFRDMAWQIPWSSRSYDQWGNFVYERRLWCKFPKVEVVEAYQDWLSLDKGRPYVSEEPEAEDVKVFREGFRNSELEVVFSKTVWKDSRYQGQGWTWA